MFSIPAHLSPFHLFKQVYPAFSLRLDGMVESIEAGHFTVIPPFRVIVFEVAKSQEAK
jgi:hypothetical protein